MATVSTTVKKVLSQGPDRNIISFQRSRTIGDRIVNAAGTLADDNTTDVIWASGDGGVDTFDHGEFHLDPYAKLTDGSASSSLILELASSSYTIAMQVQLERVQSIPGMITDDVDGTLEAVNQIRIKNTNADEAGDLDWRLALFGGA